MKVLGRGQTREATWNKKGKEGREEEVKTSVRRRVCQAYTGLVGHLTVTLL